MEPPSPRPRSDAVMLPLVDDFGDTQQQLGSSNMTEAITGACSSSFNSDPPALASSGSRNRPPPMSVVLVTKKASSSLPGLASPSNRLAKRSLPKQLVTSTSPSVGGGGLSSGPSFRLQPRGLKTVVCASPDVSSPAASQRACRGRKRRALCLATSCGATPSTLATKDSFSPCSSRGESSKGGDADEAALNTSDEENSLSSTSISSPRTNEARASNAPTVSTTTDGSAMMVASPLRMDSLTIQSPRDTRSVGSSRMLSPKRSPLSLKHGASSAAHAASSSSASSVRHHPGSSFILYASSPANSMFVRPRSNSLSSSVASPARSSIFMNSPASSARSTPKYAPLTVLQQSDESRGQIQGTYEASSPPTRPSTTSSRRRLAMDYSPEAPTPSSTAASPAIPEYSSLRVLPKQQRKPDRVDCSDSSRSRSNSLNSPPSARRNILSSQYSPFSSAGGAANGIYSTPKRTPPLGLQQRKRPQKQEKDDVILGVDFVSNPPKTQRGATTGLFSSLDDSKPSATGSAGTAARMDAAASETNDGFQVPLSSPQTRKRTFLFHSPSPRTPVRPEASPLHPGSAASSAMSTPLPKVTLTPRSCPSSANGRRGRGGGGGSRLPSFPSPSDVEVYSSNFLVEQKPSNKRRCAQLAVSHPSPSGEEDTQQLRGTFLFPRTRAQDGVGSEATSVDTPMHKPGFPTIDSDSGRLSSVACKSSNSATEATESTTNSKHSSSLGSPSSRFLPQPRKSSYVPLPGGWLGDSIPARSSGSLLNLSPSSSSSLLRPSSSSGREFMMVATTPSNADDGSVLTSDNDEDDEDAFILAAPGVLEEERQQQQSRDVERARQRRRRSTDYEDLRYFGGLEVAVDTVHRQNDSQQRSPFVSNFNRDNGPSLFDRNDSSEHQEDSMVVDSNGSSVQQDNMDPWPSGLSIPPAEDVPAVNNGNSNDDDAPMIIAAQEEEREFGSASRDDVLTTPPPPAVTDSSQLSPPLLSVTRSVHE